MKACYNYYNPISKCTYVFAYWIAQGFGGVAPKNGIPIIILRT